MSYAYRIDPQTGEIIERVCVNAAFTSESGRYYKPKSTAEEDRIQIISKNAKRLRELNEAIEEEDWKIVSCGEEAMLLKLRKARESKAKERIRREQFAHTVSELARITDKAINSENILVNISGETVCVSVDEYTGGGFTRLMKELERLDDSFRSDDEENVKNVLKDLVRIEEDVDRLMKRAYEAFMELALRRELAQAVIDQLHNAGWISTIKAEGSESSPLIISISDPIGNTAQMEFCGKDEFMLYTPGFSDSMRSALQTLVLGVLHQNGAAGARGRCMDHEKPDQEARESGRTPNPAAAPAREHIR